MSNVFVGVAALVSIGSLGFGCYQYDCTESVGAVQKQVMKSIKHFLPTPSRAIY